MIGAEPENEDSQNQTASTGVSRLAWVVFVLALVSSAIVFGLLGRAQPLAFEGKVALDAPVAAATSGASSAIVDGDSRRVLVLDEHDCLRSVIDLSDADSPIDAATDVSVANDGCVYVSGLAHAHDSDRIEKECIVAYRPDGSRIGVVYTPVRTSDRVPTIKGLSYLPDGTVAAAHVVADEGMYEADYLHFIRVGLDESTVVDEIEVSFDGSQNAAYNDASGRSACVSLRGVLGYDDYEQASMYPDAVFTSVDVGDDGAIYACDDASGDIVRIEDDDLTTVLDGQRYTNVHVANGLIVACDTDADTVVISDASGNVLRRIQSVDLTGTLLALSVLFWIGCTYLVALSIALVVRWAASAVRGGRAANLAAMLGSVTVVLAIGIAVLYLASQSYEDSMRTRSNEVGAFADYLSATSYNLGEAMEAGSDRAAFRKGGEDLVSAMMGLAEVDYTFTSLAGSAEDNNIGIYFAVYANDADGVFHVYDSALEHVIGSNVLQGERLAALEEAFASGEADALMHEGRTLYDTTLYRLVGIPGSDGEGLAGVVELGTRSRSLAAELGGLQVQRIIALLVMILVVYLTYCELRSCGYGILQYHELRASNMRDAAASLTRVFTFLISILQSIDAVMTVLIAQSLLQLQGMEDNALLIALPSAMLGVGLVAGQVVYRVTATRTSTRNLIAGGAFGMALFAMACAVVVHMGSFPLFCLAKFAMSISFGLLYTLGYTLPRVAQSADVGDAAAWDVTYSNVSAGALGTVLGGYAAQMLGYAWVYVLVAIVSGPLVLLALGLLPRDGDVHERQGVAMSTRSAWPVLLRSPAIWVVFVCMLLPLTLASGYNTFLFPLYSADVGLREADINNLFVLGQLVAYVSVTTISRITSRIGVRRVVQASVALSGAVLMLLVVNGAFAWAVAAVAAISVLCTSGDVWQDVWLAEAAKTGVPPANAVAGMFAARSIVITLQPAIMGAILLTAGNAVVTVIGLFCFACAAVSLLAMRRRSNTALPVAQ